MNRRSRRWVSIFLLAVLGFSQGTIALAACGMDRATLVQALTAPNHQCCDEAPGADGSAATPMSVSLCVTHATDDLQLTGNAVALMAPPPATAVLHLWAHPSSGPPHTVPPLRGSIPSRILLHSFLI